LEAGSSQTRTIANGENIIVDSTLSNLEKARQLTDRLNKPATR
jgi:hypothetical protein